jgi:23S rRNA pseudouridine1911/1915/1917 synthase
MNELDILFEDNHLIVVIKPAGVLSQADITGAPDMLSLIKAYLKEKYQKPGDVYLGLLHRLDRPVSGVMVFAKTSKCASRISAQIREGKMTKMYRAIVCGEVSPEEGTLHGYLLKNDRDNIVKVFLPGDRSIPAEAKQSSLAYRVLSRVSSSGTGNGVLTLLEIDLHTGRSHQIRAQLAKAGFPILGDQKYGSKQSGYSGDICLEAFRLEFDHPVRDERMIYEKELPLTAPWSMFQKIERRNTNG